MILLEYYRSSHSSAMTTEFRKDMSCCFDCQICSRCHWCTSRISTAFTDCQHILIEHWVTEGLSHLRSGVTEIMDITSRSEVFLDWTRAAIYSTEPSINWIIAGVEGTLCSNCLVEVTTRSAGQFRPVPTGCHSEGRASGTSEYFIRAVLEGNRQ